MNTVMKAPCMSTYTTVRHQVKFVSVSKPDSIVVNGLLVISCCVDWLSDNALLSVKYHAQRHHSFELPVRKN